MVLFEALTFVRILPDIDLSTRGDGRLVHTVRNANTAQYVMVLDQDQKAILGWALICI